MEPSTYFSKKPDRSHKKKCLNKYNRRNRRFGRNRSAMIYSIRLVPARLYYGRKKDGERKKNTSRYKTMGDE